VVAIDSTKPDLDEVSASTMARGASRAEGTVKGTVATERDLPIVRCIEPVWRRL
jgi:hypothetical protein